MYLYDKNRITYFAETDRRNKRIPFGIKAEDRTRHMYIIGKTGMGKSTMIENMAVQDIKNGEGIAFIDPHGKSADLLLDYIPSERVKDVIYFAPFDMENPISFNIMEDIGADKRHLVANGLMSVFKKIWVDAWSARMEYILSNVILALLEYPDATLLGVNRMLTDKAYRKKVVDNIKDPSVKTFWVEEYAKYSERYTQDATPAIQNKIGQFTSNPLIRNIIGQPHSSFDLRKVMDERKILIVNLSKGQVGEGNANLLGSMIITKIYLSAMSRADLLESELKKLPNFYMFVDEFQSFANESFANILSEARKYKLSLIMAHQYIEQMSEEVTAAVFGNVGTQIMFRVGATDAEMLEKEYAPVFTAEDMVNLGFTQIYLKLMIDGVASHPFSAVTLPPITPPEKSNRETVIASSRELYARKREFVESEIDKWYISGEGGGAENPKQEKKESQPPGQTARYSAQGIRSVYPPRDRKPYGEAPQPAVINERPFSLRQETPRSYVNRTETPGRFFVNRASDTKSFANKQLATNKQKEFIKQDNGVTRSPQSAVRESEDTGENTERQIEKPLEKPFARAFKELSRETSEEDRKDFFENNSKEKFTQNQYKKNIGNPENLNNLKSALASVLRDEKEKSSELKKEEPVVKEKNSTEAIKEVPEDVLTAILRGED